MTTVQHISQVSGSTIDSFSTDTTSDSKAAAVLEQILAKHPNATLFKPSVGIYKYIGTDGILLPNQIVKGLFVTKGDTTRLWYMTEDGAKKIYSAPAQDFQMASSNVNGQGTFQFPLNPSERKKYHIHKLANNPFDWLGYTEPTSGDSGSTTGGDWTTLIFPQNTTTTPGVPYAPQTSTTQTGTPPPPTTGGGTSSFWSTLGTDFTNALPNIIKSANGTTIGTGTVQVTPVTTPVAPSSSSGISTGVVIIGLLLVTGAIVGLVLLNKKKPA